MARVHTVLTWTVYTLLIGLPLLRYANLRSNFFDLGQYINILNIAAESLQPAIALSTHAQLVIPVYALFGRMLSNPYGLLAIQSLSCILAYRLFLKSFQEDSLPKWLLFAIFFSSMSIWFTALNDFHFEHILFVFYLLFIMLLVVERSGNDIPLIGAAIMVCFVKEIYALSAVMMGVMAFYYGRRRAGLWIIGLSAVYFLLVTVVLIPAFSGGKGIGALWGAAFGYLGNSPVDMAQTLVADPKSVLTSDLLSPRKLVFVVALMLPFAYVAWLAPVAILPALPSILVMLLSRNPNHAYLGHHYTALVTVVMFGGCIISLRFMRDAQRRKRLALASAGMSFVMLVLFGPAPVSRLFWSDHAWSFQAQAYLPDARTRQISALIEQHIPDDRRIAVSVQNSVNHVRITDRPVVFPFPLGIFEPGRVLTMVAQDVFEPTPGKPNPAEPNASLASRGLALADYVVIDTKRPLSLEDLACRWSVDVVCDDPEFRGRVEALVGRLPAEYDTIAVHDGFAIYRRKSAAQTR